MGNGNIPYFFRIRKFAVGLPLAGNGNIPYFFRMRKFTVGLPLAGNGNTLMSHQEVIIRIVSSLQVIGSDLLFILTRIGFRLCIYT